MVVVAAAASEGTRSRLVAIDDKVVIYTLCLTSFFFPGTPIPFPFWTPLTRPDEALNIALRVGLTPMAEKIMRTYSDHVRGGPEKGLGIAFRTSRADDTSRDAGHCFFGSYAPRLARCAVFSR